MLILRTNLLQYPRLGVLVSSFILQKSLSTVRTHRNTGEGMAGGCSGNKTTPTTHWHLQPAVYDDGWREGEGEGGVSDSSSQYNECWQSTSTVDSRRHGEEEEEEEEGEGGGGEEGEREREEGGTEENVDGATGQSTIAKLVSQTHTKPCCLSNFMSHDPMIYS